MSENKWNEWIGVKGSLSIEDREIDVRVQVNENGKAVVYIMTNSFMGKYENIISIPATVHIEEDPVLHAVRIPTGDFVISKVCLRCNAWYVRLPKTVESVEFDYGRSLSRNVGRRRFIVDEENPFMFSENGSLYSKDGILYHFCDDGYKTFEQVKLRDDITTVLPDAVYSDKNLSLVIPNKNILLQEGSIRGYYNIIDFSNGVSFIKPDAFSSLRCKEIRINGLLSDITDEGKQEIRNWYHLSSSKKVIFAAPRPKGRILDGGFIELSEVVSMDGKVVSGIDTRPICINADINKGIVRQDDEDKDVSNVPIIIRELFTGDNTYESVPITHISFATNIEIHIYVYEQYKDVKKLIQQSYQGM